MSRFDALADRLPSPWRPDDDDVGRRLLLTPADVIEVRGPGGVLPASVRARGTGVVVSLPRRLRVSGIRLAAGTAAGPGHLLELRTLRGDVAPAVPTAVAPVRNGAGRVAATFRSGRFSVELIRRSLAGVLLQAVADELDGVADDGLTVQEAHWLATADRATTSPYVQRHRQVQGLPPLRAAVPADLALIEAHPYLHDLGRLAGVLGILPYEEPVVVRETVEAFRRRLRRLVALYRGGLATLDALHRMVAATLPELPVADPLNPVERDRPFTVEEPATLPTVAAAATAGVPDGLVGPLMRWDVDNTALAASPAVLLIDGLTAAPEHTAPTVDPVVQLHSADGRLVRRGIAWAGTVPAGRTLRVRPTASSWLGGPDGLARSDRATASPAAATVDPTAPGPWTAEVGGPTGTVVALHQTLDGSLVAGANDAGAGTLWRYDGRTWTSTVSGLPPITAIAGAGDTVLVATEDGVRGGRIHPAAGVFLELAGVDGIAGPMHALAPAGPAADRWLVGGDAGLQQVTLAEPAVPPVPFGPVAQDGSAARVLAVHVDARGLRWVGLDRGLAVHQPGLDHWYAYLGGDLSETVPDWTRLALDADGRPVLPDPAQVYLPAVRALHKAADESLWLGTERGLARYRARPVPEDPLSFTTLLEAFPDLGDETVHALAVDPRGRLWIVTQRGLFTYDGRDFAQHQGTGWVRLGQPRWLADGQDEPAARRLVQPLSPAAAPERDRSAWRFDPATAGWQRWSARAGRRFVPSSPPMVGADRPPARTVAWTTGAVADLLTGDDPATAEPVPPETLSTRWQPAPTRIVDGGIPAVPAVPPGRSVWRYLRREGPDEPAPDRRPAWTVEGRLLPDPDDAADPAEARFDRPVPAPRRAFDETVFAYPPSATVRLRWQAAQPLSALVRLQRVAADEVLDPLVVERVWAGIQQVRPAGVRVQLAVEDDIVGGGL